MPTRIIAKSVDFAVARGWLCPLAMWLVIADGEGAQRELTQEELAALPQQIVYRSGTIRSLTIHGVRVSSLSSLFPECHARFVTLVSAEGKCRTLPMAELEHAVVAYRLDHGPLSAEMGGPFRLLLQDGQRLVSVSSLRRIVFTDEAAIAA
jgi:hypothetical protein